MCQAYLPELASNCMVECNHVLESWAKKYIYTHIYVYTFLAPILNVNNARTPVGTIFCVDSKKGVPCGTGISECDFIDLYVLF